MKKLKILLLPLVLIITCACKSGNVTPITEGLAFNAHVLYFDKEYVFSCELENGGKAMVTLIEPELISGAKIIVENGTAHAEYKDIKYPVDLNRAEGAPYFLLKSLIDAKDKKPTAEGDAYILYGENQGQEYKITFSGSGIPLKITADNIEIEIMDAKIKTTQ